MRKTGGIDKRKKDDNRTSFKKDFRSNKRNDKREDRGFDKKFDKRFDKPKNKKSDTRFDNKPERKFEKREEPREIAVEKDFRDDILEGRNPIMEVLKSGGQVDKIFVLKGKREGSIIQILAMAREKGIVIQEVEKTKLDELSQTGVHQGIIAFVPEHEYVEVQDILEAARGKDEDPFVIILDEISDPHNLGSILRSANAAGAHGVIIPKRRSVGLSAVVAKSSAGAIEYVPVARVANIVQTIEKLKKDGLWIIGAEAGENKSYFETDMRGPIAIIVGSEGEGIGRLIKEKCDYLVRIPMKGQVNSLNAGVAAALLMFEVLKQRG